MKTTLIWTALPNGAVGSPAGGISLRLSVLVSPRLDPEGPTTTLGAFDLGINDNYIAWIQNVGMSFAFGTPGSEATFPGTLTNAGATALDPSLWPLVFPTTTTVRGYNYESLSSRRLRSFPVRDVVGYLADFYGTLAKTSPDSFPAVGTVNPTMTDFFLTLGSIRARMRTIEEKSFGNPSDLEILDGLNVPVGPLGDRALAFYKAYRFYRRRVLQGPAPDDRQPPAVPEPEFHEMVAIMSDYPILLRKLGLILDYEVSVPPSLIPPDSYVRAVPAVGAGVPTNDKRPLTAYLLIATDERFYAKPRAGSELSAGMLNLSDANRHSVAQVDVDGSALKLVEFAGNIRRLNQQWPQGSPPQEPVPALRTGGFAIAQYERASRLASSFPSQDQLNNALESGNVNDVEATPLFADDVTRGFRPDVLLSDTWYSLCRRVGNYTIATKTTPVMLGPLLDEGYVKGASVSGEADIPEDLYAHEVVFGWDGWSLGRSASGTHPLVRKGPERPTFPTDQRRSRRQYSRYGVRCAGGLPARAGDASEAAVRQDLPLSGSRRGPRGQQPPRHPSHRVVFRDGAGDLSTLRAYPTTDSRSPFDHHGG